MRRQYFALRYLVFKEIFSDQDYKVMTVCHLVYLDISIMVHIIFP